MRVDVVCVIEVTHLQRGEESAVLRPCEMKWFCNRGNWLDLSGLGMLCNVCGHCVVVEMLARIGEGWIELHVVWVVVGCVVGRFLGGM